MFRQETDYVQRQVRHLGIAFVFCMLELYCPASSGSHSPQVIIKLNYN